MVLAPMRGNTANLAPALLKVIYYLFIRILHYSEVFWAHLPCVPRRSRSELFLSHSGISSWTICPPGFLSKSNPGFLRVLDLTYCKESSGCLDFLMVRPSLAACKHTFILQKQRLGLTALCSQGMLWYLVVFITPQWWKKSKKWKNMHLTQSCIKSFLIIILRLKSSQFSVWWC